MPSEHCGNDDYADHEEVGQGERIVRATGSWRDDGAPLPQVDMPAMWL